MTRNHVFMYSWYSEISTETEKLVALTLTTFFGPNIQELSKFECLEFQGVNIDVWIRPRLKPEFCFKADKQLVFFFQTKYLIGNFWNYFHNVYKL